MPYLIRLPRKLDGVGGDVFFMRILILRDMK